MRSGRAYWRVICDRWQLVATGIGAGLVVAVLLIVVLPARYTSETSLLLDVESAPGNVTAAYDGELLAQQKVQAYIPLFTGPQFAGLVSEELARRGAPDDSQAVQQSLGASSAGESPVIRLTASGTSARQAQDRASAAATAAAALVASLEAPDPATPSPITARVVAQASPPGPPSPSWWLVLVLGLLLGLAGGVIAALGRESADDSVRTAEEAERAAGAPVLGVLDEDRAHHEHPLILHQSTRSERAEQIRTIRTTLALRSDVPRSEVLLVTSALPTEGKTTLACDLALSVAQSGRRVLLLNADLHRPRFADFLGIEEAVGLSTVLTGRVRYSDAIQRWGPELLGVLPAGRVPDQPLELLNAETMRDLLVVLRREYDLVIMDTPPILAVADASVLGPAADGAILVVARGCSRATDVELAASRLRAVGPLHGIVVNRVREESRPRYVSDAAFDAAASDESRAEPVGPEHAEDAPTTAMPVGASHLPAVAEPDGAEVSGSSTTRSTPLSAVEHVTDGTPGSSEETDGAAARSSEEPQIEGSR